MKKDPIIRMLFIIILGTIAFQLFFNLITGGENTMHDSAGMGMSTGNSFESLLSVFFVLLIKILLLILVLAIIVGVFIWIKNNFLPNMNINFTKYLQEKPLVKGIIVLFGAIIGLLFVMNLTTSFMNGTGTSTNFDFGIGITSVFTFLIQILSIVFVITLIVSLVAYFKNEIESGKINFFKQGNMNAKSNNEATNSSDHLSDVTEDTNDLKVKMDGSGEV